MKIAFWSNVRGQCGTTLHLICMAAIQAIFDKKRVVLMENHDHLTSIETGLVKRGSQYFVKEYTHGYNEYGLENLLRKMDNSHSGIEERWIRQCAVGFVHNRLFYLPHGYLKNRDLLDYQFGKNLSNLFIGLEKCFDAVYIDTFAAESLSTKAILEKADLVVVNLNQNDNVLNHFFNNFSMLRSKSIFLLGNYHSCGNNTIKEIKRKYQISDGRIFAIPFCMEAAEAESDGSITSFIGRNYLEPSINNREFITALHDAYSAVVNYSSSSADSDTCGFKRI